MIKDLSHLPLAPPLSRRYNEEFHWMLENINALTEVYPDQWVAIADKQVVAAGKIRGEVQNAARKKIYLAVPEDIFASFFELPFGKLAVQGHQLKILMFDSEKEVIVKWIE